MVKMKLMEHAEKEQKMERLNTVLRHPLYQQYYEELREEERDRIFCCHQMEHLLDVARIAYIRNLENNLGYSKELLYTTAILHDIGKALQYKEKIPHEIAGAQIAEKILDSLPEAVAYTEEEKKEILTAIRGHRRERKDMTKLERLLYESDKCSRNCFACPAKKECNWSEEKKNREILI